MAAHSFTAEVAEEAYLKSPATCTAQAEYYKSCAVCGLTSQGTADEATFFSGNALDHDWGAWTSNGDGTHTRICKRDTAHTETETCTGGTATCTAKAVCTVCGGEYGEMAAHSFTAEVAEEAYLKSPATCTAQAEYYKSCAVCGLTSQGTADEATFFSGNALDHDWGAWTSNGDGTHTRTCKRDAAHTETGACTGGTADCMTKAVCDLCQAEYGETDPTHHADGCKPKWTTTKTEHEQKYSRCGKVVTEKAAHTFGDWKITKQPTSRRTGEKTRSCTVCPYKETGEVPTVSTGTGPKTGDGSRLLLWSALLLAGASGLTAAALRRRKQRT